jgi:hypothetical protein
VTSRSTIAFFPAAALLGACVLPDYQGSTEAIGAGGATSVATTSSATGSASVSSTGTDTTSASVGGSASSGASSSSAASGSGGGDGGAGGEGGTTTATSVQASTGVGGGCLEGHIDPCIDAVSMAFDNQEQADTAWDEVAPDTHVEGGHLVLQQTTDKPAAVRSKNEVQLGLGVCSIFIKVHDTVTSGAHGLALGAGDPPDDHLRLQRNGSRLQAVVGTQIAADIPFVEAEMKELRIRIDESDEAHLEFSSNGDCWYLLSGPHPVPVEESKVRLFHSGAGITEIDSYCRP